MQAALRALVPRYSRPQRCHARRAGGVRGVHRATEEWTPVYEIDVDDQLGHPSDALWPWTIAGDEGRVAFTWLGTSIDPATGEYDDDHFYLDAGYTLSGVGTDCDGDGEMDVPPQFSVANATDTPMHVGQVCTGTGCNLGGNGNRRLGDFHSIQIDHTGRMFIVSGDTTRQSVVTGPSRLPTPIFVGASADVPLLKEAPDELRPTRCTQPLELTPLCDQP